MVISSSPIGCTAFYTAKERLRQVPSSRSLRISWTPNRPLAAVFATPEQAHQLSIVEQEL